MNKQQIPPFIHQTAKTVAIPEKWQPLQAIVKNTYPEWEYKLWTDEDNLALVKEHYPQLLAIYQGVARPIMRVDMIRYMIMDRFGGLYLDLDYEFLRPYNFTVYKLVLPRESADDAEPYVGNAVFASAPGHPFWKAVLAELLTNPPSRYTDVPEEQVIDLTGPGLLTRVYRKGFLGSKDIHVPSQWAFNPPIPDSAVAYQTLKNNSEVYGIHYCHGTWRALTQWERLHSRVIKAWRSIFPKTRGSGHV